MSGRDNIAYDQIRNGAAVVQTGNYTAVENDAWTLQVFNSASAVTLTLPNPPPSPLWRISAVNIGAGTLSISPNGLNLNGSAGSGTATTGQGIVIYTDGANYFAETGGAATGGGGAGGVPWWVTSNPTLIAFSWRNQGGATVTPNATRQTIFLSAPAVAGDSIRGREIAAPASPVSITIGIIPFLHNQNFNQCGLYVTDGTKLITIAIADLNAGGGTTLTVNKFTNVTTFASQPVTAGMGYDFIPVFLKVLDDGTNLTWYWSPDGANFEQLFQEARTAYLTSVADIGFYVDANNATWGASCLLVSWVQGAS